MDFLTVVALVVILIVVIVLIALSIRIVKQWERVVVLYLGKFVGIRGPGLVVIIPFLNTIPYIIDTRVITTSFNAEQTLTKDTVPVDVDAVLFWQVFDVQKAALEVQAYKDSVLLAAQTALRDVIGKTMLADMLAGREMIDTELQKTIQRRIDGWGINVLSVEIRDVEIPVNLQNAMSMQAQAERERQARVILGDSERQIAKSFEDAAKTYAGNPTALHLQGDEYAVRRTENQQFCPDPCPVIGPEHDGARGHNGCDCPCPELKETEGGDGEKTRRIVHTIPQ